MTNETIEQYRLLTPEQLYEILTPENKAAVNRQIEILLAAQSSD